MKYVYFVRHGESESNARTQSIYKGKGSPLTEKGRMQARRIAERAAKLPFDVLISSPWTRTRETAEAISRKTGKEIELSDLFTEFRAPLSCIGMSVEDPALWQKLDAWHNSVFSDGARIEDGENFEDLMRRAREAFAFLDARIEEKILVATHGLFLRFLIAYMILGDDLTPSLMRRFSASTKTDNTGITLFTRETMPHHESDPTERWRLRVFNDHSHLA